MNTSTPLALTEHCRQIDRDGYTILEGLLTSQQVEAIRSGLKPWLQQKLMGRNDFEGFRSERVYALLSKVPEISWIVEHPAVLELLDHYLEPNYLLSSNLAINVHPGETPQNFHADHTAVPNCPRTAINGMSSIWAFDDFTEDNGATEVLPGSHLWKDTSGTGSQEPVKVIMPAGSCLVFHGSLLHRGGANQSTGTRLAITPQFCQAWLRQLENMTLAIPPETAGQYSEKIQAMLGYSVRDPGFMGYVDGVHPRRLIDNHYQGRRARGVPS